VSWTGTLLYAPCAIRSDPVSVYRLRPATEQDLRDIWDYGVLRWSETQAESYLQQLFDRFEEIAAFPAAGEDVSWIRPQYRRRRAGVHVIFYQIFDQDTVDIVRVLHQRMDVERQLGQ
jgi:toxin ParE1/3/4